MNLFLLIALAIAPHVADQVGDKIWQNECSGKVEFLTCWNKGENFASLGIGHFIWYPGEKERFQETFPQLVLFLQKKGIECPKWLQGTCPWKSREEFYAKIDTNEMKALRKLLIETKSLQAVFIAERLESACVEICATAHARKMFDGLKKDPQGLYALIDYLNFKGEGTAVAEKYAGKGWGLAQVLEGMKEATTREFVKVAKVVLSERVKNAPQERGEERWLKGWHNRLDTYIN